MSEGIGVIVSIVGILLAVTGYKVGYDLGYRSGWNRGYGYAQLQHEKDREELHGGF